LFGVRQNRCQHLATYFGVPENVLKRHKDAIVGVGPLDFLLRV
jgi:hypothetical protein